MKVKFLGTAGARFVVAKQIRSSAGTVISANGLTFILDPGPGTLVRLAKSRPKIDSAKIDGVLLSHIHLDHSCDANVIIDAFTQGGFTKKGFLFTTKEALFGENRVILPYLHGFLEKMETFEHKKQITFKGITIQTFKHRHTAETFGIKITSCGKTISFIVDTAYFDELNEYYANSDILIINTVRFTPKENVLHLSKNDAEELIKNIRPQKAILTHFGMTMLRAKPFIVAKEISDKTRVETIAASDGMSIEI